MLHSLVRRQESADFALAASNKTPGRATSEGPEFERSGEESPAELSVRTNFETLRDHVAPIPRAERAERGASGLLSMRGHSQTGSSAHSEQGSNSNSATGLCGSTGRRCHGSRCRALRGPSHTRQDADTGGPVGRPLLQPRRLCAVPPCPTRSPAAGELTRPAGRRSVSS